MHHIITYGSKPAHSRETGGTVSQTNMVVSSVSITVGCGEGVHVLVTEGTATAVIVSLANGL